MEKIKLNKLNVEVLSDRELRNVIGGDGSSSRSSNLSALFADTDTDSPTKDGGTSTSTSNTTASFADRDGD